MNGLENDIRIAKERLGEISAELATERACAFESSIWEIKCSSTPSIRSKLMPFPPLLENVYRNDAFVESTGDSTNSSRSEELGREAGGLRHFRSVRIPENLGE